VELSVVPSSLVAIVAIGMGLAFYVADRESPISRVLALAFVGLGLSVGLEMPIHRMDSVPAWARWTALADVVTFYAFLEWILRVRQTVPATHLNTRFGDRTVRVAQLAALFYGVAGLLAPEAKFNDFLGSLADGGNALANGRFWLFAVPTLVAALGGSAGALLFLRRKPDLPEQARILGMIAATPWLIGSLVMPHPLAPIATMLGLVLFLIGAVRYHVLQGKRGEFMARFMSRKVADLVRRRGLQQAMQETSLELTVVCIDLRGFTAYAETQGSTRVVQVLREYYHVASEVVARYDGTIKDLAGDGILVLIGAPLPVIDHARCGLEMAAGIRDAVRAVAEGWTVGSQRLGVGIGVASGTVVVGAIDAGERYEYTAVGSAVNLASRLCEEAADGEILVAQHTLELCERAHAPQALEQRTPIQVKGFAQPVLHHNLRPAGLEGA
jgi:adenylate cyclase